MARTWLSIRVDLVQGRGERLWPRPGRVFAVARSHTFADLAEAIDTAFARWDLSHLHEFRMKDGTRIGLPDDEGWPEPDEILDDERTRLSRLALGEQFIYEFDFGDGWLHLCTVGPMKIDPLQELGIVPPLPLPYEGWGSIPDQYGRTRDGDMEAEVPPDPHCSDLPSLEPGWGEPDDQSEQSEPTEAPPLNTTTRARLIHSTGSDSDAAASQLIGLLRRAGSPARKQIQPGDKVEVRLSDRDRELLFEKTLCDSAYASALTRSPDGNGFVGRYTLDDLEDIAGYVASEANHTRSKKLQRELDDLCDRLSEIEKSYGDVEWPVLLPDPHLH